jgi:hypothetical protein
MLVALEDRKLLSTWTVNSTGDAGSGSGLVGDLRYCISGANAAGGDQTMIFDSSFNAPQTITLTLGELELSDTTGTETITGPSGGLTIDGNAASRVFQVDPNAMASISGLTITGGNTAGNGAGLFNSGTTALIDCTITGNTAAAVAATNEGGGIYNNGTLSVTNSTIYGNQADYSYSGAGQGGGIFNSGLLTVTGSTISRNAAGYSYGGGIENSGGAATLTDTIVAGNNGADIDGPVSGTSNLIGTGGSGGLANGVDGNLVGVADPGLGTLGDYGGPTETIPLLPGSPAIDAGTSAGATAADQRGEPRVGPVDIGAFESQGFTMTAVAGSTPQSAGIGAAFAAPLAVTVKANNPVEPVDGVVVTFAADPATNGASAILLATSAVVADGQAGVTGAPNDRDGSYTITATIPGLTPVTFALTNTGPTFTRLAVNTTNGTLFAGAGLLTLPTAVAFANADAAGNANITFDNKVFKHPQTITLGGTQIELSNTGEAETITAPAAGVTISGCGLSRVFQVDPGVTATLSGLTITGGDAGDNGSGGGLLNDGTVTLSACTISGNTAGPTGSSPFAGGNGGGISNLGTATLIGCTVTNNSANADYYDFASGAGGGVYNGGTATLTRCTISGNSSRSGGGAVGGAVATDAPLSNGTARTSLIDCTVGGNSGGGVSNDGTTTLTDCTVDGNSGDGVDSDAALFPAPGVTNVITLTDCTISGNSGTGVSTTAAAIYFSGPHGSGHVIFRQPETILSRCTVSGNQRSGLSTTGGITTAIDTTIRDNTSAYDGGGVVTAGEAFTSEVDGTTNLSNCTVSGNSAGLDGGGVATGYLGITTATNTTIRDNTAGGDGGGVDTFGAESTPYGDLYATTNLTDCTISGNYAGGDGGGLNNGTLGSTTVIGSNIRSNSAIAGGGVANQGTLNVLSSNIINNTATSAGGGLSTTAGTATITDSAITRNEAIASGTALGGGIDCENSTLSLTGDTITANHAVGANAYGGGIYALGSTVNLQSCTVNGNQANGTVLGDGGGIYAFDTTLTLVNTKVKGNKATTDYNDLFDGP